VPTSGTWRTTATLPSFTFANNEAVQNVLTQIQGGPAKPLSDLYSYLRNVGSGTESSTTSVIPTPFDLKAALSNNSSAQSADSNTTTPEQDALHAYGNAAGIVVQSLESSNATANTDLDAFFKNPSTATAAPVTAIAHNLTAAAAGFRAISSVPTDMQLKNETLAAAYANAGAQLAAVATLRTPSDILTALDTYNKSVENLGTAFIAIVTLFSDKKVQFSPSEPGSAFSFTGGAL
jgi:hypothetical protein